MDAMNSMAHAPRVEGGKPAVEVERDDLRDLLHAILQALDVPPGAERAAMLDLRAARITNALRAVLTGEVPSPGIPWEAEFLRRRTAEDRPVPYTLTDKARTAVGNA